MTREETKKCIEIMQAYVDGKTVGYMRNDGNGTLFFSESKSPAWNWFHENYIVKPQPMKVTEEEKKIIGRSLIWTKCKKTGHVDYYLTNEIDSYRNKFYILNSDTMEWQDWSENAERLKHHYNGGQP